MCVIYFCKICSWKGSEDELEQDKVDTCFGDDCIAMCPVCGSYEVAKLDAENTARPG